MKEKNIKSNILHSIDNAKHVNFFKEILNKFQVGFEEKDLKKVFQKKNFTSISNLLEQDKIEKIKDLIKNKSVVLLADGSLDSNVSINIITDYLKEKNIPYHVIHNSNILAFNKIKEDLYQNNMNFKNSFFISTGNILKNYHQIKNITSEGSHILSFDNTRIGNDFIPKKDIEGFLEKNDKLILVNNNLNDYENKYVSKSIMATKVFTHVFDKNKNGLTIKPKEKVLLGLSVLRDISKMSSFENQIIVNNTLELLNNNKNKNTQKKINLLKEALKIDAFDVGNVNTRLIPLIFNIEKYFKGLDEDDKQFFYKDFSEVIDFMFNDSFDEKEFKTILRNVLYINDKNKLEVSERYNEFQSFLSNNKINDKNIFVEFKDNKLIINGNIFPEKGEISYSESLSVLNKLKSSNYKNVFLYNETKTGYNLNCYSHEKLGYLYKKYIKENKGDINRVGGEDLHYSFLITNIDNFKSFIENNYADSIIDIKDNTSIKIDNFDFLNLDNVKIIKRELGLLNPNDINFEIVGTIYGFSKLPNTFEIKLKDSTGKSKVIRLNEYFYNYLLQNHSIGDEISLYIKPSITRKVNGLEDIILTSDGILSEKYIDYSLIKSKIQEFKETFKSSGEQIYLSNLIKQYGEKNVYQYIYSLLGKGSNTIDILNLASQKLIHFNEIANSSSGLLELEQIKKEINSFLIKPDTSLEKMLDLEKNRLLFSGSKIIPFLIKPGNEVFLGNINDRGLYQETLSIRNNLYKELSYIADDFNSFCNLKESNSFYVSNSQGQLESFEYLRLLKNNVTLMLKRLRQDQRRLSYNEEEDSKISVIEKTKKHSYLNDNVKNEVQLIEFLGRIKKVESNFLNLRTNYKTSIYTNYLKLTAEKRTSINLLDTVINKEKLKEIYFNDRFNDRNFYFNFFDFNHFFQTISIVYEGDSKKMLTELGNYLNVNNFNSKFDGVLNLIQSKNTILIDLLKSGEFVKKLNSESLTRFKNLIDENLLIFQDIFNISLLETDIEKISEGIYQKVGLILPKEIVKTNINKQETLFNNRNVLINSIKSLIKENSKSKDYKFILDFINDGKIGNASVMSILKDGLEKTKYLDNGYLAVAYIHDLLSQNFLGKEKNANLLDTASASFLSNDFLFLKNTEFDFLFKILKSGSLNKKYSNLLKAHNKEFLGFLSQISKEDLTPIPEEIQKQFKYYADNINKPEGPKIVGNIKSQLFEKGYKISIMNDNSLKLEKLSINRNRGIIDYYYNIFNVYKLDDLFISNKLIDSAFIRTIYDNIYKLQNQLLKDFSDEKIKVDYNLTFVKYLKKILNSNGEFKDGNYFPKDSVYSTTNSSKSGYSLEKISYIKILHDYHTQVGDLNNIDNFRKFIGNNIKNNISGANNDFRTSQSEALFIYNLQRKLFRGFSISKTESNFSYKDLTKELFVLLNDEQKHQLYNLLSKLNSYGKNLIPDFVIRNQKGNIVGIGEVYGGNSNDTEKYEATKIIKNDILKIFNDVGVNIFTIDYDDKDFNGKMNTYLINFNKNINKGDKSIERSLMSYNKFIEDNNLVNILSLDKINLTKDDLKGPDYFPINKLSMNDITELKNKGKKLIFFDTETTGFGRKGDPLSFGGGSIFQLAYSSGDSFISHEFNEIKGPLTKKIEDLTHWKRSEIIRIGKDPIIGMTEFLKEIIGEKTSNLLNDKNISKVQFRNALNKNSKEFGILIGHNSYAFDSPMIVNMIKYINRHESYKEIFLNNPKLKILFEYFEKNGFEMGDTLSEAKKILNKNNNFFIENDGLGNKNNKLGHLYELVKLKEGVNKEILYKRIEENAHNAQFDIEMTKDVFEYIEKVNISSNERKEKAKDEVFYKLFNSTGDFNDFNRYLQKTRNNITTYKIDIDIYNRLIKNLLLKIGNTDIKLELNDNTGRISLNRVLEYKRYYLDENKIEQSFNDLGINVDNSFVKESISKMNASTITKIIKNLGSTDDFNIYDDGNESLRLKLLSLGKDREKTEGEKIYDRLINDINKPFGNNIDLEKLESILNELIIKKDSIYEKYKDSQIIFKRETQIVEESLKKLFSMSAEKLKKSEEKLFLSGITLRPNEKKILLNKANEINITDINFFADLGIKTKKINNGVYLIEDKTNLDKAKKNEYFKTSGLKFKTFDKNIYVHKYNDKSDASYKLTRSQTVNVEKVKYLIQQEFKSNIDKDVLNELLDILITKRINNKNIYELFKDKEKLYKALAKKSVSILSHVNFIK